MKIYLKHLLLASVIAMTAFGTYAAPPRLMVLPDRTWCSNNGFLQTIEKQGKKRYIEQYDEAFMRSADLKNVKTTINKLFADRGFPLEDAEQATSSFDEEEDEEEFMESTEGSGGVRMTPEDILMNKFKPDITLKVGWEVNPTGFDQCITYRIEALDSYSNKSVAVANGTGPMFKRSVPLAVMLEQSVLDKMPGLTDQLMRYFDDVQANGREIAIRVRFWDGTPFSLSTEFGGQELGQIIYRWLSDNTINHQFTRVSSSPNGARYNQVRIPLRDEYGVPLDAKGYVDQLRAYLRDTYNIQSDSRPSGLGNCVLVLGSK